LLAKDDELEFQGVIWGQSGYEMLKAAPHDVGRRSATLRHDRPNIEEEEKGHKNNLTIVVKIKTPE
jgi:hypothetical protein